MSLYPYQEEALKFLEKNNGRGLLAMEPGTGKTRTALTAVLERLNAGPAAIVAPLNALGVWEDEAELIGARGFVKVAPRVKRAELPLELQDPDGAWALNYEQVAYRGKGYNYPVVNALVSQGVDTLIVDESHYIKSSSAIRTRAVTKLAGRMKNVILLTGTPITKNLLDLYTQMKVIKPDIWNRNGYQPSFTQWKRLVGVFGGFEGREVIGYKDVDRDILKPISPYVFTVTKAEALDLPPTVDQLIPVRIPATKYRNIKKLVSQEEHPLTRLLRWQQVLGLEKVPITVGLARDLLEMGKQVIIFHRFREEGAQLRFLLKAPGINGDVGPRARRELAESFRKGHVPALVIQIQAGSTALNLQSASEVIFHTTTWDHAEHTQARDRAHRIGQTQHVTYRYVVARGPVGGTLIDEVILQALRDKRNVADAVMSQERNW